MACRLHQPVQHWKLQVQQTPYLCIAEKKAYTLTLLDPPIRSRYIIGSSFGWIITADGRSELHLVNPITSEQIALPSVTTIGQVKPVFDDEGAGQNILVYILPSKYTGVSFIFP